MQKLINVLAVLGFGMGAAVTGTAGYVYVNQDAIKENIKQQIVEAATAGVTDALPGMMGGSLPKTTGGAIPAPFDGVGGFALPSIDPEDHYTNHAMGCMLLKECTDGVDRIYSSGDLRTAYPDSDWDFVANEFDQIMLAFEQIGVEVHLADSKYFPIGHRGVYHTVSNHFYLNKAFMHRPGVLMSVTRHEGWHAAQDCMAGTIDNSLIAIIKPEDEVPGLWREMVERSYPEHAVPWEAEATWAGKTEGMTQDALAACATGAMWEIYEPTPLTREFLEDEGYISK